MKDLSEVGLYFSKTAPRKQVKQIGFADPDAVIPASAELQRFKKSVTIGDDAGSRKNTTDFPSTARMPD